MLKTSYRENTTHLSGDFTGTLVFGETRVFIAHHSYHAQLHRVKRITLHIVAATKKGPTGSAVSSSSPTQRKIRDVPSDVFCCFSECTSMSVATLSPQRIDSLRRYLKLDPPESKVVYVWAKAKNG
jgi:hypothetical protein